MVIMEIIKGMPGPSPTQERMIKMKRIASLALVFALALSLVGCSGSKPDTVITTFCNAVKAFDFETAATCMENGSNDFEDPYDDAELEEDLMSEQVMSYLKDCASQLTYQLGEATIDGDAASVPVSISYVDASPVITSALGEYIAQALGLAFSGADEAQMEELFGSIFMEKTESVQTAMASDTVVFKCVKVDGDWKIAEFDDDAQTVITNILTSNIAGAFENFGEGFDDGEDESPADTIWHDIPLGQEVELATLKLCVTNCEEVSELTGQYMNPDAAQEGTKYVVFSVKVENTTKDTLNFNNDLVLTDSQGRSYDPYFNALWYYDETFSYTDLAPNIAKSGVFVYNVPTDSSDYYLSVLKANTDDGYRLYAK
jgi:hypothetical protein